jgi:ATP-dependent DNA ligase
MTSFMLSASMDSETHPLLDEQKLPKIFELIRTDLYTFEPKINGMRAGLGKTNGVVTMPNRRGIDHARTHHLPELEAVAATLPDNTMLDGEVTVLADPKICEHKTCDCHVGYPCRLLTTKKTGTKTQVLHNLPAVFIAWDIRMLDGENLEGMHQTARRALLEEIISKDSPHIQLVKSVTEEKDVIDMFLSEPEGMMAKLKSSKYVPMDEDSSNRPRLWIKIKHTFIKIVDVMGYCTEAGGRLSGKARNFVIAENGVYRGTVGGGFTDQEREEARAFLDASPNADAPYWIMKNMKHPYVHKPDSGLKMSVIYQEFMPSGILFQPRLFHLINL